MKRIKIFIETGPMELDIEVLSDTTCRIDTNVSFTSCFVFGSYVEDVHTIKKDDIFSIGIAAIKEIDQKQVALEARLAQLEEIIRKQNERIAMVEK
jgi:hypothetical protein